MTYQENSIGTYDSEVTQKSYVKIVVGGQTHMLPVNPSRKDEISKGMAEEFHLKLIKPDNAAYQNDSINE